jgi:lipoprotein-anchoring transpeptidase ErfK/SrfK
MDPHSAPDIYLMKREKSRTGCMTVLIVTIGLAVVGGIFGVIQWHQNRGTESAEPIEFPEAPIEADLPPVPIADVPVPGLETPAPAPVPTQTTPAPESVPTRSVPDVTPPVGEPPAPAPAATGDAAVLFSQAQAKQKAGDYEGARNIALNALQASPGAPEVEAFLSELAIPLLASERPMAEKVDYTVKSGDYLGKLAATFNTPVALIAKANEVQGATIRLGETLRLFDGNNHPFALTISKSRNDLLVTLDGKFFKRYRVSTGEHAKTPTGTFKVIDKIAQPAWHKPGAAAIPYGDPENLLGTHWIALDLPGYGIHGTWEPETLGRQSSAGCIRMLNAEVEELYTILPRGTLVTIIE